MLICFVLSPGRDHDATAADAFLDELLADSFLLTDQTYDAEWIRNKIEVRYAIGIIPDRNKNKHSDPFSPILHTLRNRETK